MKKTLLIMSLTGAIAAPAIGQDLIGTEYLSKKSTEKTNIDTIATIYSGNLALGINQGILHNWSAGGELASITINGTFFGNYTKYMNRSIWANNLDLAYGLFYAYSNKFVPRKIDDRIDFTSKYGYRIIPKKDFYFTTLLNARTQFTKAYDYSNANWSDNPISGFLSPLYITFAPGIEYRRGSEFSVFFSPLAMRYTHVSTDYTTKHPEGAFGVEYGKTTRLELGAYLTARYNKNITENLLYNGRIDLYSNYLAKDLKKDNVIIKRDHPGNIDALWDNNFSYKFWRYFSVNLGILAIYDNDVPYNKYTTDNTGAQVLKQSPTAGLGWWQVRQMFSIGFNYKIAGGK